MLNENERDEVSTEGESAELYIETIKKLTDENKMLKQTTVPKSEHKKLLDTILEGGELEAAAATAQKRTPDEIRKELFGDDADTLTNLAFAQKAIELREAILAEGGIDPFVPQGHKIMAEESDFAAAEKVAEALQSCIDYADGNPEVFTNELMRITADISPVSTRARANGVRR